MVHIIILNYSMSGTTTWDGATAKVTISGGSIIKFDVIDGGSGYSAEKLEFDPTFIGSPSSVLRQHLQQLVYHTNVGDVLQITGIGTLTDGYFRISSVPSTKTVAIAKTGGDTSFLAGQYALNLGPAVQYI